MFARVFKADYLAGLRLISERKQQALCVSASCSPPIEPVAATAADDVASAENNTDLIKLDQFVINELVAS